MTLPLNSEFAFPGLPCKEECDPQYPLFNCDKKNKPNKAVPDEGYTILGFFQEVIWIALVICEG
jgi:hypothetical protein